MPQAAAVAIVEWAEMAYYGEMVLTAAEVAYAATALQVAATVAFYGYSASEQRRAAAAARAAANDSLKDREVMIRSGTAPRRVIYGRDKVSGPLVFGCRSGSGKEQFLHLVVALAAHECDAIERVFLNDVEVPIDADGFVRSGPYASVKTHETTDVVVGDGSGTAALTRKANRLIAASAEVVGGGADSVSLTLSADGMSVSGLGAGQRATVAYEYTSNEPKVRIRRYLGSPGQTADPDLIAASAGRWTAAHRGDGICYLYVRLEADLDLFSGGPPNISAIVRGKRLRDPRTGATAWTDNAALIAADWLHDRQIGMSVPEADVSDAEVVAAANACDEPIAVDHAGATQPRYTFNGSITAETSPGDALQSIMTMMSGACVWSQGRWLIRPGVWRAPGLTITDDMLAGRGVSISPRASLSSLFNAVRATFRDTTSPTWAEVQAPLVTNAGYELEDGNQRLVQTMPQLPGACESIRAQRLAKVTLERARQALTVQLTTTLAGYNAAVTDNVLLNLPRYGWSGKAFEVLERSHNIAEGTITYTLRETAPGIYAWNFGEATIGDLAPQTDLPNGLLAPDPPQHLAASSAVALQGGSPVGRVTVTWDRSSDPFVAVGGQVELAWRRIQDAAWIEAAAAQGDSASAVISPVSEQTTVVVRARFVRATGRASAWSYVTTTVGKLTSVSWTDIAGRPVSYRVGAAGYSATNIPFLGLALSGSSTVLWGVYRSYSVVKIDRATGGVGFARSYDVYGAGEQGGLSAANMAADLNGMAGESIVVIYTYDEPAHNRMDGGLAAAMYRCGASRAVFGSPNFKSRSAYILVGIAGCGEGNGFEAYRGDIDNDPNAWLDITLSTINGAVTVSGAGYTPRQISDFGQVQTGDLASAAATEVVTFSDAVGYSERNPGYL